MRCSSPQVTTCSTASNTLSQEARKQSAVSFHERRRAQRARKRIYTLVKVRLPSPQGASSTGHHATAAAADASHRVQQEDEESPQRDELEAPLGELVVSGRRQMAPRADCGRTFPRSQDHFDAPLVDRK